ncbi:MAG: hypothetical protein K0Q59_4478 [Paenibacillus sp.]|nr:hypothetical protein [Paenibacillus sp.]
MKSQSFLQAAIAGLLLVSATTACSGDGGKAVSSESDGGKPVNKIDMTKPMELTYYTDLTTVTNDNEFKDYFGQYIQKKYPNITFKNIYVSQTKKGIEEIITDGTRFDFAHMSIAFAYKYVDLKVASDISDLIKKYNVNLNAINPIALEQFKGASRGQLTGIPFQFNSLILFYNKAIFDKFGVPYPKDNMTWQDMADMTRKLTRFDGGVQYTGFASQLEWSVVHRSNQLSMEPVDPKTNKATFGNGKWKQLFDEFAPIFQITGNKLDTPAKNDNAFLKEQSLAMTLANPNYYLRIPDTMNWDMAAAPSLKEKPGVGFQPVPSVLAVSANSPFRDQAFLAMMEMVSKTTQLERAKNDAYASVLNDPDIRQSIGSNVPALKGKNTAVMQPLNMAPSITFMPYTREATLALQNAFNSAMSGAKDTNTALREAEEIANQKIAEILAAETKTK